MANIDELYPSKYIKAGDLKGQDVAVVITSQTIEEVGKTEEKKPVLWFEGKQKGLILNRTNANVIGKAFGRETGAWAGKSIVLYPTQTEFGGEMVDAVRIRPPAAPEMALEAKPDKDGGAGNVVAMKDEMNDSIPF